MRRNILLLIQHASWSHIRYVNLRWIWLAAATSHLVKSVSFCQVLKDVGACTVLRKKWLAKIPRENTPLTPNSGIQPDEENDSHSIFLSEPVISKHYTRVSTKGDFHIITSMPNPHSAADFSSEEHMSDVCSAMLSHPIDLESARDEKSKELSRIGKRL